MYAIMPWHHKNLHSHQEPITVNHPKWLLAPYHVTIIIPVFKGCMQIRFTCYPSDREGCIRPKTV